MKCKIPEISWHNRDPVLSVDIQPKTNANNYYRLASGGTDAHVLIWYMKLTSTGEYGDIELDLAADLTRHQRAVNAVKWSPNGELLASGDDESVVFIWKLKSDSEPVNILDSTNEQDKEVWITLKVLRGHMEDIYDLSWAPNSLYLVSGSVDNSAMVWDVQKGKSLSILNDHKGFVQGVAWDPKNQYIATLSTDRYLRIFDIQSKKVLYRVSKGTLPVSEDNPLHGKRMRLFHDDTLQTFFRRLTFTPDGKLLLTPAGVTDYDGCTRPINTTYAFSRYGFRQPAIVLPCPDQYTVAVKCCPILYKLRPFNAEKNPPVVPLPYRMIFAVATKSSVYFYDTQQKPPFALISNIHYTRLTDITWSNDGRIVVVSSTDGFCSLITFEAGELGEEYENSEAVLEAALAQVTKKTKKQKDNETAIKSRKPSTDDSAGGVAKENNDKAKDVAQLEKIVEQNVEQKDDKPTPIAIKRKAGNDEKKNEEKDDSKQTAATPIAIKRKPGPVEDETKDTTKTNVENKGENKDEQKPTPIAIKRKPGPVTSPETKKPLSEDKTATPSEKPIEPVEDTKTAENKDKSKATPIAIKRKPGPVNSPETKKASKDEKSTSEELVEENKSSENKDQQKATPIAIKRKPGPVDSTENKNDSSKDKDTLKTTEKTEQDSKEHEDKEPIDKTKDSENKNDVKATSISVKRKSGPENSAETKKELSKDKDSTETTDDKKSSNDKETSKSLKETTPPKRKSVENEDKEHKSQPIEKTKAEQTATPIAVKRKPGPTDSAETKKESCENKISALLPSAKSLAAEIILDKEILSSEEKFESPEKKSRPVTPILVRRHPRTPSSAAQTPSSSQTPTSMSGALKTQLELQNQSPLSSLSKEVKTPRQDKTKAKPIAVRRAPRSIITTPSVVNAPSMVEEAMDAWPLSKDANTKETPNVTPSKDKLKESGIAPLPISDSTCERTEDIRLVYEETNEATPVKEYTVTKPAPIEVVEEKAMEERAEEEKAATSKEEKAATSGEEKAETLVEEKTVGTPKQKPQQHTPSGKTPRRVALKTISTPKSKKKLLD